MTMKKFIFAAAALALMSSAAMADPMTDRFKEALAEACGKIETLESGDLASLMRQAASINKLDGGLIKSRNMTPETLKTIANAVGLVRDVSVLFQMSDGKELPNRKLQVKIRNYEGKDYKISCESGLVLTNDRWFQ